jgi:hypothetical protein
MAQTDIKPVSLDNNPYKLDLDRPEDGTVEGTAAPDLELSESVSQSKYRLEIGGSFEGGTIRGNVAMGGIADFSVRSGRLEKAGDTSWRLGFGFGVYSSDKNGTIHLHDSSEYQDDENCLPGYDCEPQNASITPANDRYPVSYNLIDYRVMFSLTYDVGIVNTPVGMLALELSPQLGWDFTDSEKDNRIHDRPYAQIGVGLAMFTDFGLKASAGVNFDFESIAYEIWGSDNNIEALNLESNILGNVRLAYAF